MGGDEFAVLLVGKNADDSRRLADRLLESLREPFTISGQEIFLTASVGVASSGRRTADTSTRMELLREADLAMYDAKDAGRNRSSVFLPLMRSRATERLTLQADLQYAVPGNQLRLYYQPTVELDTLRVVGFEALLRWDHPERGLIPPSEFISLAEETGLIVPIGRWVLYEACRQLAHWQRTIDGCEQLGVAINVSGRQLQARGAVSDIADAIGVSSLDPADVTIEITESLFLTDTEAVRNQMQALKQLGVRLAIDDFGTGYSSLSYLSRFPLDVMKIDKSFLVDVCSSADRHAFLRSIIDMGHTLHLSTLGEGIENESELELLRACGCDLGQGFLFARPLTPDQATEHLTAEATSRRVTAA
jgi:EAL domain-containing protein (putative c-di-GMP-specific phosphodiesterase class I)